MIWEAKLFVFPFFSFLALNVDFLGFQSRWIEYMSGCLSGWCATSLFGWLVIKYYRFEKYIDRPEKRILAYIFNILVYNHNLQCRLGDNVSSRFDE